MERTILHVDANCFYASVECLYNSHIQNKPVAVVGDVEKRHGIVLTANYIAKRKFGVKTGDVVWEAKRKCPNLVIRQSNMPLYIKVSKRMNQILLRYSDMVEAFGIDESWIDVTNSRQIFGSGMEIAQRISEEVKKEIGITVSIGVSFNKVFSKLGSDYKKPDAITEITRDNFKEIVWPLPISDLLFVGRQTTKKLILKNIRTIGDIANANPEHLKTWLGKWGGILYDFANGKDEDPVLKFNEANAIKSIGNSMTAYRDLENEEDVKMLLFVLADSVARRLREQGLYAGVVSVTVKNNKLISFSKQVKLSEPTNLSKEIAQYALGLFAESYNWYNPVRALGIAVSDLSGKREFSQVSIYNDEEKKDALLRLEETQDELKKRFGSFCVQRGILMKDSFLTQFDPKLTHTVYPGTSVGL